MSFGRLRILCLIDSLQMGGGAEQLLADLLPEMRRRGMDIEVATLFRSDEDLGAGLESDGIKVHRLDLGGRKSVVEAVRKLRPLVRAGRYDVFWGHLFYGNFYAALAKRLAGRGTVAVTLHCVTYSQRRAKRLRDRLFVALERLVPSSADLRVAVSEDVRRDYATSFGLRDILVIYNGTNCGRLDDLAGANPGSVRSEFGFAQGDFLIVMPASFLAKKAHGILLAALERLRVEHGFRPKVFLCGDGPLAEAVAGEAARLDLTDQVTFSPAIPHEKLVPLIASAQGMVLPSYAEGLSLAAAEAMALGTPCVFTNIGSFRELTGGSECALLVPPGDPQALADAIMRLRSDHSLAASLGERGRERIRSSFHISTCAENWIAALQGAAGRRSTDNTPPPPAS